MPFQMRAPDKRARTHGTSEMTPSGCSKIPILRHSMMVLYACCTLLTVVAELRADNPRFNTSQSDKWRFHKKQCAGFSPMNNPRYVEGRGLLESFQCSALAPTMHNVHGLLRSRQCEHRHLPHLVSWAKEILANCSKPPGLLPTDQSHKLTPTLLCIPIADWAGCAN
jgi:hypothetical protein